MVGVSMGEILSCCILAGAGGDGFGMYPGEHLV